jgi:biopolymer transport protein ExbB
MTGFVDLMFQGGWLMIPIGACSFVAVTIIVERAVALRRANVIDERIVNMLHAYEGEEHTEAVYIACRRSAGAFARVIEETLRSRHLEHAQAIETMHAVGRTQIGRLERGLTLLEIIAGISPLLGLLGTVIGMVRVFDAITAQGLGNPQVLSGGISQALVTTVAGLIVAIPALAFHSLLSKRVDDLATQMQNHATGFIVKLQALRG